MDDILNGIHSSNGLTLAIEVSKVFTVVIISEHYPLVQKRILGLIKIQLNMMKRRLRPCAE
jgi:hypothetical protein